MFDLDISKMIIVGIVALAVIPPKDLPRVMRTVGQTVGKMRRMAAEFQGQFMEAMREVEREADLEASRRKSRRSATRRRSTRSFDPVGMVRDEIDQGGRTPVETGAAHVSSPETGKPEIPEPAAPALKSAFPKLR